MSALTNAPTPIAIVGMSCRFPGGATSRQHFWDNLIAGVDGIREVPPDRWDRRKFTSQEPGKRGATNVVRAGFLQGDVFGFDPDFFGISTRDAEPMDIQQRLLLETAWEAFEDAGLTREQIEGSRTGVFVGAFFMDVNQIQLLPSNRALLDAATATAGTATMVSNRLSFAFNLRGPSVSLDTACSSSLVATHLACRAIAAGDADQALVGGANFITLPEVMIAMSKGGFLSPDGYCYSFDARANGYVRAEGAGMVLLKRLDLAERDGDRIYAVIEATGCNQDGRTPQGITFPNGEAQRELLSATLERSGVRPRDVQYLEAHGTGTQAGDTTELTTLHGLLAADGVTDRRWVGSLKSQIGHLEAAAGVGSLMKTALAIHHGVIPPNLHFETPNPALDFDNLLVNVPTAPTPWPAADMRRAVINGFGYGGTNACVLLRAAPPPPDAPAATTGATLPKTLVPVAARNPAALRDLAARWADHIERHPDVPLVDIARTAQEHRTAFEHRLVVAAADAADLGAQLRRWSRGEPAADVVEGRVPPRQGAGLAFVYSGMGPQWWAMGRELLDTEPVFRAAAEQVDAAFRRVARWSILDAMRADEHSSRMGQTAVAQPANFLLQVALTRLLQHHGIEADAMVGHSVGEVAALYLSGSVTLTEAVTISYHRSRLQQQASGGGMLAVGLGEAAFRAQYGAWIDGGRGVALAAVNSPNAITLAGDLPALAALGEQLQQDGHFQRALRVDTAYHSHHMDPIREELLDELDLLRPKPSAVPLYSTVSGGLRPGPGWGAAYWWQNVRAPVRFAAAIEAMVSDGYTLFLEIGPHPVLAGSLREIARAVSKPAEVMSTLRRQEPERRAVVQAVAELFVRGVTPAWPTLRADGGRRTTLPHYPFQRIHLWRESEASRRARIGHDGPVFLTEQAATAVPTWNVELNDQTFPFVPDHKVSGASVFPGAGYLAAAVAAQHALAPHAATSLHDVRFVRVLTLSASAQQTLQTSLDPTAGTFRVHSSATEGGNAGAWVLHAEGRVGEEVVAPRRLDLPGRTAGLPRTIDPDRFYDRLAAMGLVYGPAFRTVRALSLGAGEAIATLEAPEGAGDEDYRLSPILVDGAFQCLVALMEGEAAQGPYVPTHLRRAHLRLPWPRRVHALLDRVEIRPDGLTADITWTDEHGEVVGELFGITCRPVSAATDAQLLADRVWSVPFRSLPPAEAPAAGPGTVLLLPPRDPALTARLVAIAEARGLSVAAVGRAELDATLSAGAPDYLLDARDLDAPEGLTAAGQAAARLADRAALLRMLLPTSTHLEVLTRRALRAVPGDPADLLSGGATGNLLHVATNEQPELRPRLIDADDGSWDALARELFRRSPDTLVALRGGDRFGPQWERLDLGRGRTLHVDPRQVAVRLDGNPADAAILHPLPAPAGDELTILVDAWSTSGPVTEVAGTVTAGTGQPVGARVHALLAGPIASQVVLPAAAAWADTGEAWGSAAAFVADHALRPLAELAPGARALIDLDATDLATSLVALAGQRGARVEISARTPIHHPARLAPDEAARRAADGGAYALIVSDQPGRVADLLAPFGHLVALSDDNAPLPANATRHALDAPALLAARPDRVARWRSAGGAPVPRQTTTTPWHEPRPLGDGVRVVCEAPREPLVAAASSDALDLPSGGTWIVTGGTRGFGLALAAWLGGEGARHLVLVSRSGRVSDTDAPAIEALRAGGVSVDLVALDVADPQAVAGLAQHVRAAGHRLTGIVHAAVVYADQTLAELTPDAFHQVFAVKALAAHALYDLAVAEGAELLLCISSISALIGNRGQASYVAANSYLDALAQWSIGQPGPRVCSVNLGALSDTGFAQTSDLLGYFERAGILPVNNREALRAIRQIVGRREPQAAVSGFAWPSFSQAFAPLMQTTRFASWRDDGDPSHRPLGERLASLDASERPTAVVAALRQILGDILKTPPERIDEHRSAASLGIDSLTTMELTIAVQRELGVRITAVDLLAGPSVAEIADLILARHTNLGGL